MEQRVTSEETVRTNDVHCDLTTDDQRAELRKVTNRGESEGARKPLRLCFLCRHSLQFLCRHLRRFLGRQSLHDQLLCDPLALVIM